jgi:hypothetical protein
MRPLFFAQVKRADLSLLQRLGASVDLIKVNIAGNETPPAAPMNLSIILLGNIVRQKQTKKSTPAAKSKSCVFIVVKYSFTAEPSNNLLQLVTIKTAVGPP